MKHIFLTIPCLILLLSANQIFSQSKPFQQQEKELKVLFDSINNQDNQQHIDTLNKEIQRIFRSMLQQKGAFTYSFDSLEQARKLMAEDERLAILTYPIRNAGDTYTFYGFIQIKKSKNKAKIYALKDFSDSIQNPEQQTLSPENWYGAFYYDLITTEHQNQTFYTLLGWDGHDLYTNRKVIDILYINRFDDPVFGAPLIQAPGGNRQRRVFKFSQQAVMTLRYDKRMDMIVYDHLAPQSSFYEGEYQYYGPDFTQDALEFIEGRWKLHSNIEATNPRR